MRNQTLTVFVALVLVLAGCAGAPTDSTTATPTDGSSGGSGGSGGGSDGSGGGAGDADEFVVSDAEAALRDAGSFTSTWSLRIVDSEGQESTLTNAYYVDLDANRTSETFTITGDDEGASYERFIADGTSYTRFGDGTDVLYQVIPADGNQLDYALARGASFAYDDFEEATFVGTETFDGVTVDRYEYTDPMLWRQYGAGTFGSDQNVTITDFTLVALVDQNGIARSSGWELVGETESGERVSAEWRFELTDLGSTDVPDPEWLDEAREEGTVTY
ncbi:MULTISPECIES: hypothetical protein [Haloferax]|uniref:Lipoprotein n=1 Tax=Haloferax marinum TaxID=2666143 RepID=A0A6A8GAH8_9EURY|nr:MULTISPECIES: hypothetical protein [Haloferax]KAB1198501.1 hypothetical protein Hfx1150_13650 [Haloferax sp. CBA1150]MRW97608.1 hypothetical protein [Haloferax marinum]